MRQHPVHPMLIVFPIALWVAALVFDITYAVSGNSMWRTLAFYDIAGGIIGALAAAIPGLVDYTDMQGRARRIATWHMLINFGVVAVFAVNWLLRARWGTWFVSADYVERVGVRDAAGRQEEARRRVA